MVVENLKYIGPFLRINTLSTDIMEKQLSFFSRESFKHIVLNSRCGITTSIHQFKFKNIPNFDINIFKKNSPLLCIYKKANPKLSIDKDSCSWDSDTFKKEVPVGANAFMTLTLIEAGNYYKQFQDINSSLFAMSKLYSQLAVKQLDFFSSNLRNAEGVFVDKKDSSEDSAKELVFEDKAKKFKFSDQALLMAAYHKASQLPDNNDSEAYKSFSFDILKMFLDYKSELYDLSLEELNKLCFAVNIFYDSSKDDASKYLLTDLCDFLIDKYYEQASDGSIKTENMSMLYINMYCAYNNLALLKFKEESDKIFEAMDALYDSERGLFITDKEKKEIDYSSEEIVLYTVCQLLSHKLYPDSPASVLTDVYKRQFINSGVILSWPETPNLSSPERYRNFSMKSEDLIEDHYFRMPTLPTPEHAELAPILIKSITYNNKKDTFEQGKGTFDSSKNMFLLFSIQYLLKEL